MTRCDQHPARERWRKVPGASGYKVSSRGRFRSVNRVLPNGKRRKGQLMRTRPNNKGYPIVDYTPDHGERDTESVHVLELMAFRGARPPGQQACHLDDNPAHNCLENLRWDFPEGNQADRRRNNPAKEPKPPRYCILCGQVLHTNGRRCGDCVQDIGYQAARALEGGATPEQVAAHLRYPHVAGVVALAIKHGGYGQRPAAPSQPVTSCAATLSDRTQAGDAA